MVCPLEVSCASRLQQVHNERRRLEMVLWQRACDNFAAGKYAPISACNHADGYFFLIQWVNVSFFHEIVPAPERELHRAPCSTMCAFNYSERAKRFLVGFCSYATPIRSLHATHLKLLAPVATCCKLDCTTAYTVCSDFSMQIFAEVNKLFFDNTMRVRKTTISPYVIRQAQNDQLKSEVSKTWYELYKTWHAKRVKLFKMLPPNMVNGTALEQPSLPYPLEEEEVDIQFLN